MKLSRLFLASTPSGLLVRPTNSEETLMGYRDATYVIFDGGNDKWAYGFMKGWKENENVDFNFRDAHDLDSMTGRAQSEAYVKAQLRERMKNSSAVIVLIGEGTK